MPELSTLPPPAPPRPAARLEEIASRSADAIRFFHDRFGPLAVKNVVISPIPGGFGQGFPGLVYASTLSYFGASDAPLQNYSASQQLFFTDLLRTHEIAHQWWGNVVSSDSISEVWLTEALATYSALLYLEDHLGQEARNRVLAEYRDHLLAYNQEGVLVESAGPIVLGERLRSSLFPNAPRVIMYEKGAWILHMLRSMMGDTPFLAFLRRLCETYRLRMLTTADFQKEAVRFLPEDFPDPKLENFFQHWVYGTGIPSLEMKWDAKGKAPSFRMTGRLIQNEVPESSSVLVPVEVHTLPGRSLTKWILTEGKVTEFGVVLQNKPSRVVVDPTNSILLRPRS
jgi:aminopeptidase N